MQAYLKDNEIPTMVYYPKALHEQTAYKSLNYPEGSSPVTEVLSESVLSLPIHPYITEEEINKVVDCIVEFLSK